MATKSIIPESNLLYKLLFGAQRQGIKTNLAVCDLICMKWKKEGQPVTQSTLIHKFTELIKNPGQFDWLMKAFCGEEVYSKIQSGSTFELAIDATTGKANVLITDTVNYGDGESPMPEFAKEGDSLQELYDKYLCLGTPMMYEGLDSDNEKLLSVMGRCAEVGIL